MQEKSIDEIIRLVLTGEASRKEIAYLNAWLAESKQNQKIFHQMELIWYERADEPEATNAHEISERIWQEGVAGNSVSARNLNGKRISYLYQYIKIAAVFLLVLSLPLLVLIYKNDSVPALAARIIEKSNPVGHKVKLQLPDGSFVWLNAESRIRFEENFAGTERVIELEGEAYFEVKKNKDKPFVVRSGKVSTTAIGTSFNITAYPEDSLVQVALISGKVKVNPDQLIEQTGMFFLEQGDGIDFNKNNKESRRYQFNKSKVMAWKQGVLLFDGDSFEEVKNKLRRWYGVEISVIGSPPQDWKLTGRFTNEYLKEVLENIRFGRSFTYDLTGNQLIFDFTTIKS